MSTALQHRQEPLQHRPSKPDVESSSLSSPTSSVFSPTLPHSLGFAPLERTASCAIPLTRGYVALVDPEDFARFGHLKWTAAVQRRRGFRVYAYRSQWIGGKCFTIFLHREILAAQKGQLVDHVDRNTLDCRKQNLRIATPQQNCRNRVARPSKHGFIGVDSQTPGSYRGRVFSDSRTVYTKTFSCPVMAAVARDVLAQQLHGEYAAFNFHFHAVSQKG